MGNGPQTAPYAHWLERQFPEAIVVSGDGGDVLPRWPGAYLLAIYLPAVTAFALRGAQASLDSGWYAYAGSAKGPGGVGARLARHFRAEKKPHWHVDRLTIRADAMFALAMQGRTECEIVARLNRTSQILTPLSGFGSSDCRRCEAHLLKFKEALSA